MQNDNGIYILVSPTTRETSEYRVASLNSNLNLTWEADSSSPTEALDPAVVKIHFDKSEVFDNEFDAQEEAYRLSDNSYITHPPVYNIYLSTPYINWSKTSYGKEN